ncbi:MAG TPA: 16S rRNA (guanine(527)-N(7))-methyltransferase RsmG [Fibrobacteres bacterium]|jgi:16S rRNA (guanine527-N7)-methyltransferase|nr:16S rRNA (guanine(527)-N(7))-methyltransferase RsmG [Fibrobacterota bacterium]
MSHLLTDPANFDEKIQQKLRALEAIYLRWNKNLNLVSKQDEPTLWERHIVDSLQIIPFFNDVNKLADMGAGVGLPSLVLAIAKPDIDVFAIEPIQKKCSLMQEIIREVRIPNLHVLTERVEKVYLSHMDVVCCRAFGEFYRDARLAYKMLKPQGQFITFKTQPYTESPQGYEKVESHPYVLPGIPRKYFVIVATKTGEA